MFTRRLAKVPRNPHKTRGARKTSRISQPPCRFYATTNDDASSIEAKMLLKESSRIVKAMHDQPGDFDESALRSQVAEVNAGKPRTRPFPSQDDFPPPVKPSTPFPTNNPEETVYLYPDSRPHIGPIASDEISGSVKSAVESSAQPIIDSASDFFGSSPVSSFTSSLYSATQSLPTTPSSSLSFSNISEKISQNESLYTKSDNIPEILSCRYSSDQTKRENLAVDGKTGRRSEMIGERMGEEGVGECEEKSLVEEMVEEMKATTKHVAGSVKKTAENVSEKTKEKTSEMKEKAKEKAEEAVGGLKEKAKEFAEKSKEKAKEIAGKSKEKVKEKAKEFAEKSKEKVKEKTEELVGVVKEKVWGGREGENEEKDKDNEGKKEKEKEGQGLDHVKENLKEKVHEAKEQAKEKLHGVREEIPEKEKQWADTGREKMEGAKDDFEDFMKKGKEKVEDAKAAARELKEKAVGKIGEVPEKGKEKIGEKAEELKEKGKERVEEVKEKTKEKFEGLKEKIGGNVEGVKEKVGEKIGELKEKGKEKIEEKVEKKGQTSHSKFRENVAEHSAGESIQGIPDKSASEKASRPETTLGKKVLESLKTVARDIKDAAALKFTEFDHKFTEKARKEGERNSKEVHELEEKMTEKLHDAKDAVVKGVKERL